MNGITDRNRIKVGQKLYIPTERGRRRFAARGLDCGTDAKQETTTRRSVPREAPAQDAGSVPVP